MKQTITSTLAASALANTTPKPNAAVPNVAGFRIQCWTRRSKLVSNLVLLAGLCTLAACGKPLDTTKISEAIQLDVTTQGAPSLKTVTCPQRVVAEKGKTFQCVGELESGTRFAIAVSQDDDKGTVKWQVPHTKGLLNLLTLQNTIKQALQSQFGAPPEIDCGGKKYRSVKPGDTFECKIVTKGDAAKTDAKKATDKAGDKKPAAATDAKQAGAKAGDNKAQETAQASRPVKILVTVDPNRDVNWQQVMPEIKVASAPGKPGTTGAAPAGANTTASGTPANTETNATDNTSGNQKPRPLPPPTAEEIEELGLDRLD